MINKLIAFEDGDLSDTDTLALFQDLVNSGMAWKLQGFYGRLAHSLINQELVTHPNRSISA